MFFFPKAKIPVFDPQLTDSKSGVLTTELTVSERHRKDFSNLQSCLTDSS